MAYIKNGIVTRIDVCGENNDLSYVNKLFDLSIYEKVDNKYLLFEDVLQDNFKSYRTEYLEFSCYSGDSLSCCESYCLNVDINKLLDNKIHLTKDNKNYYFGDLIRVVQASPMRVKNPCRANKECMGCNLLHYAYPAQLKHKKDLIKESLKSVSINICDNIARICRCSFPPVLRFMILWE